MKTRLAALLLALGFLAVPALALAAAGCTPCCARAVSAPCEADGARCAQLSRATCCTIAPAAPAGAALRLGDVPLLATPAFAPALSWAAPHRPVALARPQAACDTPRRLSVVLRE